MRLCLLVVALAVGGCEHLAPQAGDGGATPSDASSADGGTSDGGAPPGDASSADGGKGDASLVEAADASSSSDGALPADGGSDAGLGLPTGACVDDERRTYRAGDCTVECACYGGSWICPIPSTPECTPVLCPGVAPAPEQPCEPATVVCEDAPSPPCVQYVRQRCVYGAPECRTTCTCRESGPLAWRWDCPTAAGPTCDAPECPTAAPAPAGQYVRCTGYSGQACSWAEGPEGCAAVCTCYSDEGYWDCKYQCSCPDAKPANGDSCTTAEASSYATCTFGEPCSSRCFCVGTTDQGFRWDCARCDGGCPVEAPAEGAACDAELDRDECWYSTRPYCGRCACGAEGTWSCTPSTCDRCPASAPSPGDPCVDLANQACDYPDPTSPTGHRFCVCEQGLPPTWSCL